jgi:hypothetical protein
MKTSNKKPGGPVPPKGPPTPHNEAMAPGITTPTPDRIRRAVDSITMLSVRLSPDLLKRVKIQAIIRGSTLQAITTAALEAYVVALEAEVKVR